MGDHARLGEVDGFVVLGVRIVVLECRVFLVFFGVENAKVVVGVRTDMRV